MWAASETVQAVTTAEFKDARNILADDTDSDAAFTAYLLAAQELVETACGRPMLPRDYAFELPLGGWRRWYSPVTPLAELVSVTVDHGTDDDQVVVPSDLRIVSRWSEPQIVLSSALARFKAADEAVMTVLGTFGHQDHPPPLQMKQAVILLATDWAEAGIAVDDRSALKANFGAERLIRQVRYRRPCGFSSA